MSHIVGILQARTGSTRLPGKVLKPIIDRPMILRQIERLKRATKLDTIVVATTDLKEDDELASILEKEGIPCYRGSCPDVLDRMYQAAKAENATDVVRLTGDCPLTDPHVIDSLITFYQDGEYDYASNCLQPTFPDGLDAEVMSFNTLEKAWKKATLPGDREHVTPYIRIHKDEFLVGSFECKENQSHLRWTVDEPADFEFVQKVYEALYKNNPSFSSTEIFELVTSLPALAEVNGAILRDEGMKKSMYTDRYLNSTNYLERAEKIIPLGSQTFSKSKTQFPVGVSPLCIDRAEGTRVWDIDNNEYLDLGSSLGAINLGYCDPDVNSAVKSQLGKGTIFPLPSHLELAVAEQLCNLIPCAEMVRFGKNGSDATTGAVRLGRAYTGKDEVITIGYHGWHDWYIGSTTKNRGVPKSTVAMTHKLPYNSLEALENLLIERGHAIGTLIMEAMNREYPKDGYLQGVQTLCKKHNVVFVIDEMITGFRYSAGGAQELFGVTPDLATFGKGIANGFPLAALVGKREIMSHLEDIFFSFTFGGEALSLAAANAVLTKIQNEPVIRTMHERGLQLMDGLKAIINKHSLQSVAAVTGHPSWSIVEFQDCAQATQWELKTLFLQEVFYRGMITIGSHMPNYAHTAEDMQIALTKYDEVFELLASGLKHDNLKRHLVVKPLEPLFKVR